MYTVANEINGVKVTSPASGAVFYTRKITESTPKTVEELLNMGIPLEQAQFIARKGRLDSRNLLHSSI